MMPYKTCLMQWLKHFVIPFILFRVMDQHKMSKEEWEQSITTWWNEHKAMLRFVLILIQFSVSDVSSVYQLCKGNNVRHDWKNSWLVTKCDCFNYYRTHLLGGGRVESVESFLVDTKFCHKLLAEWKCCIRYSFHSLRKWQIWRIEWVHWVVLQHGNNCYRNLQGVKLCLKERKQGADLKCLLVSKVQKCSDVC